MCNRVDAGNQGLEEQPVLLTLSQISNQAFCKSLCVYIIVYVPVCESGHMCRGARVEITLFVTGSVHCLSLPMPGKLAPELPESLLPLPLVLPCEHWD